MVWSVSEFLNLFEFRSQSWCFAGLAEKQGLRVPHADAAFFYAVEEGLLEISGIGREPIQLAAGGVVIVLSGQAHALRPEPGSIVNSISVLDKGEYLDAPQHITLGQGVTVARLLCGRLKVRWPGGQRPRGMPDVLQLRMATSIIDFAKLFAAVDEPGGCAVLTHTATLLFSDAFRRHPQCRELFEESTLDDPIARALRYMEMHPFQKWTVEILARKVGMGRSSFAARFTAQTGKTPIDMLTEQRMRHAADFLEKTDLKIAEVSERVGYRSEAAFHNRFTNYFGMSPGQLRREKRRLHH
jgi:AraC-like DNA-binding protein